MKYSVPHTKIGGTSFIIEADYIHGVRYTAEHCDDVALLLTCTGDDGKWLPTDYEMKEIQKIVEGENVSLHVHLPTDGHCTTEEDTKIYTQNILMALEKASLVKAHTFVQHLDIVPLRYKNLLPSKEQEECILDMLKTIANHLPDPQMLAIENLESFPLEYTDFCFIDTPYSRCVDIGHIWKDYKNPNLVLSKWLENTRLIHLHGLRPLLPFTEDMESYNKEISIENFDPLYGQIVKDHQGLEHMPNIWLDEVLFTLWDKEYNGVINLEVFNEKEFIKSYEKILTSRGRYDRKMVR